MKDYFALIALVIFRTKRDFVFVAAILATAVLVSIATVVTVLLLSSVGVIMDSDADWSSGSWLLKTVFALAGRYNLEPQYLYVGLLGTSLVLSASLTLVNNALIDFFNSYKEASLAQSFFLRYLMKPYSDGKSIPHSQWEKDVLVDSRDVVGYFVAPFLDAMVSTLCALLILLSILTSVPIYSLYGVMSLVVIFVGLVMAFSGRIRALGALRTETMEGKFVSVTDTLRAYDEIKVFGVERIFFNRLKKQTLDYAKTVAQSKIITKSNKPLLELIICLIAFTGLIIFFEMGGEFSDLPFDSISALIFGMYRILPFAQRLYISYTNIIFSTTLLNQYQRNMFIDSSDQALSLVEASQDPWCKMAENVQYIEAKDIEFRYGDTAVFTGFSRRFYPGRVYLLFGPSGTGKTTLLKVLSGLLQPTSGEVVISSSACVRKITVGSGIVSVARQDSAIFRGTLLENVALSGLDAPDFVKALQWLEFVGLGDMHSETGERILNPSAPSLSGGQLQRLSLARALYAEPQILFLDEITSGLDDAGGEALLGKIKSLGLITILVSHDHYARNIADEVIQL